jgi:PilZ domain
MPDKRNSERQPCFMRGEILLGATQRRGCEVHDISSSGARVVGTELESIPDTFVLEVPRRHIESRVKVVRRTGSELGVKFLD